MLGVVGSADGWLCAEALQWPHLKCQVIMSPKMPGQKMEWSACEFIMETP